ncbi:MAG: hypothetical protein AB7I27_15575 [Bacteriovoracaceae bacterium]
MMKSKNRIEVTEKDIDFFHYLHARKIATIDHIGRDCYATLGKAGLYKRLLRLEKENLIQGFISSSTGGKKIYNLTRSGFITKVKGDRETKRKELKSDAIKHDLGLCEINHALLKSKIITQYQTENSLQTWKIKDIGEAFEPFVRNNSDAAIEITIDGAKIYFAIEYEVSLQNYQRYKEKIGNYYKESGITRVLYVLKDEANIKVLMEIEKELDEAKLGKFFYTSFDKLVSNQDMSFINWKGEVIEI